MAVVVAFLCTDDVVVGADSMLTVSMGNVPVAHQEAKKVHLLPGERVFACSGDQWLDHRLSNIAEVNHAQIPGQPAALSYGLSLAAAAMQQFSQTGVKTLDLDGVLAFPHRGAPHCCVFEGNAIQPRMLDAHHFFTAFGSGALAASPFLRFLCEVFCQRRQPVLREAVFLRPGSPTTRSRPFGGVFEPVYVAVLETRTDGELRARELWSDDVQEHVAGIEGARQSLRDWRDRLHAATPDADVPPKPEPPTA